MLDRHMLPVPWRHVNSWNCYACGLCCKGFNVVLSFAEWMNVVKTCGVGFTSSSINKFYLKHRSDGSCVFLYNYYGKGFCSLQYMKPTACKLWPFRISQRPRYGRAREAEYIYAGKKLYIYVDPSCLGLRWGNPTANFTRTTLTEITELALGLRKKQVYSTSRLLYSPQSPKLRGRKIF